MRSGLAARAWSLVRCAVLGSMLASCGAKTGLGDVDGGVLTSRGPGAGTTPGDGSGPDGPPGLDLDSVPACPFADGAAPAAGGPYPFCQWAEPHGYERFCPPSGSGWGYLNWHAEDKGSTYCSEGADCNACLCAVQCSTDADCPAAETGAARAECVHFPASGSPPVVGPSQCLLTCEHDERCPDAMRCVHVAEYGRFACAWVTTGDRCD